MNKAHGSLWGLVAVLIAVLAVPPLQSARAAAEAPKGHEEPDVMPVESRPYGQTYGEWSARWVQWLMSIPPADHPFFSPDVCDVAQTRPMWFMTGTFANVPVTRSCTIPVNTAVLVPLVGWFIDNVAFCPGCTEEEMLAVLATQMGWTDYGSLYATIDGIEVTNVAGYRVQSPLTNFTVTSENIAGWPIGFSTQLMADGIYLILPPLAAGNHVIHIEAEVPATGFDLDMTYDVTVVSGRGRGELASTPATVGTWGLVKSLYR